MFFKKKEWTIITFTVRSLNILSLIETCLLTKGTGQLLLDLLIGDLGDDPIDDFNSKTITIWPDLNYSNAIAKSHLTSFYTWEVMQVDVWIYTYFFHASNRKRALPSFVYSWCVYDVWKCQVYHFWGGRSLNFFFALIFSKNIKMPCGIKPLLKHDLFSCQNNVLIQRKALNWPKRRIYKYLIYICPFLFFFFNPSDLRYRSRSRACLWSNVAKAVQLYFLSDFSRRPQIKQISGRRTPPLLV